MDIEHWAGTSLVDHHLLIWPLWSTQKTCKCNVNILMFSADNMSLHNALCLWQPYCSCGKIQLCRTPSTFEYQPVKGNLKGQLVQKHPVKHKLYWHCNRATNWPNWRELFSNEHQISDSLFSDRLAQTHREGRAGMRTAMQTHTRQRWTQYDSVGECARLYYPGEIKSN